jgi:hypothetical protein
MALLAFVTSISRPWVATLSAVPMEAHYLVGGNELAGGSKQFTVNVNVGGGPITDEAAGCAELAGVELDGSGDTEAVEVGWLTYELAVHASEIEGDLELEKNGEFATATLEYQTREETKQAHEDGTLRTALVRVGATVVRDDVEALDNAVRSLLTGGATGVASTEVAARYAQLESVLRERLHPSAATTVTISWHEGPDKTPEPSPDEPDPCDDGCAMSNGDPHLVTMSDDSYDFMAVGEFVLLRSADGSFELQARQEPYGDSRTVSINTALAMRAGSQRIGIYAVGETLEVRVDGSLVDSNGGPISVGGGTLRFTRGFFPGVDMTFADGTRLTAFGEFQYGISVMIKPSDALRTGSVGLMGPVPEGDGLDVPALPDGTVLPDTLTIQEYEDALYGPFEQAWRVTSSSSLFDYLAGMSNESYIDESFPDREALLSFDELTGEQRATGEVACVGIADPVLREQCIYDVFVTGDTTFGELYELTVTVVETGALPQTGAQSRVVNLYTEDGQPVDVDVYAWTWSEAEMTEVAALVATVPYGQASDWFNPGLVVGNPFNDAPYTKVTLQRHGEAPDPGDPLTGTMENLGPGTVSTLVIWQEELFDEPSETLQTIYSRNPDYEIPQAPPGQGLLMTHNGGLQAEEDPPLLYASVGEGCLEHPLADPSFPFPQPQPIGNHLMIPAGEHTLTIHADKSTGEPQTCETEPLGPGVPISVAPGDRFLVFPYRVPAATEITTLVVPFDSQT